MANTLDSKADEVIDIKEIVCNGITKNNYPFWTRANNTDQSILPKVLVKCYKSGKTQPLCRCFDLINWTCNPGDDLHKNKFATENCPYYSL